MAIANFNFESALSKERMLEIQYQTRHRAMTVAQIANEMELTASCVSPYVAYMRDNGLLIIERQEFVQGGNNKPLNFYRFTGHMPDVERTPKGRRKKEKPIRRDHLVAALFGAA
jgi:hypothetical protein